MMIRIVLLACITHVTAYGVETRRNPAVCMQLKTPDQHLLSSLAKGLTTRIFAGIGVPLEWRACEPDSEPSPTTIVVELVSRTPPEFMSGALGYAMPGRRRIVIFFDRIEWMPDAWVVLGHVMAHEITHVIQGVPRHSDTGLMKPHYRNSDLSEMRHKSLPFTQEDLLLLYDGLTVPRSSIDTPTGAR